MFDKIKTYGCLFLGLLSAFTLGVYATLVKHSVEDVNPHQWILTSIFGLFFIVCFITDIKKKIK